MDVVAIQGRPRSLASDIRCDLDLAPALAHDASMSEDWRELAVFTDRASAEVLVGLLRSESIRSQVAADEPVPGLIRSISVSVPVSDWMRAREVCRQAQMSEEEWTHYIDKEGSAEGEQEENE